MPSYIKYVLLIGLSFFSLQAGEQVQNIFLFFTNDMQSGIGEQEATFLNPDFPPQIGGGPSAATIINHYRILSQRNGDIVLLLDGGDIYGNANPLGPNSDGRALIDYMNQIGYNAMVPGNQDFDLGEDALLKLASRAKFPFVAANLFDRRTNKHPAHIEPYHVIEKQGLRIGVFGITSKSAEQNDNPENVDTFRFTDEVTSARKAVQALRDEKVDLIIALAHLGLPYDAREGYELLQEQEAQNIVKLSYVNAMELAHYVSGIDILISGKIHRGYQDPWEDPVNHTLCFQNYAYGANLGLTTIQINRQNKTIQGYQLPSPEGALMLLTKDEFWPEKSMRSFMDSLNNIYAPSFDSIIGVTRSTLSRQSSGESPMSNLMCDALIAATGADFAFNNFTGMRQDIAIGPITPRDLSNVFPFGNEVVVIRMKGKLLRKLMEGSVAGNYSGMAIGGGRIVYSRDLPDGKRITTFEVQGKALEDNTFYRVATTEYLAKGNYGMDELTYLPKEAFTYTGFIVRQAVAEYIKKHSPLNIGSDGRWVLK